MRRIFTDFFLSVYIRQIRQIRGLFFSPHPTQPQIIPLSSFMNDAHHPAAPLH